MSKFLRVIYSLIFYLITPLLLLKLWKRGKTAPEYRQRIAERFGFASKVSSKEPLWIHAVSVGEVVAISSVVKLLTAKHPDLAIVITTSTPTGAQRVSHLFQNYPQIIHQYCPYDQPLSISKFLSTHKPIGLLIVETELWPNMLAKCKQRNIPVLLANGRMSDKSERGYRKLSSLTYNMLQQLDLLVAQYASDGERFKRLGLSDEKLVISGSVKFDLSIADTVFEDAAKLKKQIGDRPVVILGSSHPTEEKGLLELLPQLTNSIPDILLIIVPRHPERFEEVTLLAKEHSHQVTKRSEGDIGPSCQVYVGDTMGELSLLYAVSDIAIVGGSFVPLGGQNPIEPAAVGKAVIMGPQQFNFSVICPEMEKHEGLITCDDFQVLLQTLLKTLNNPQLMKEMGSNAQKYVYQQRGATNILLAQIEKVLLSK